MGISRIVLISVFVIFINACASSSATYKLPASTSSEKFTLTVNKDFETTWKAIIDHISSTFFSIENFEKDSGLITVSFGQGDPKEFIDCGWWDVKWTDQNLRSSEFHGPYAEYLRQYLSASLTGKMNISARPVSPNQSQVRVNARYIFTAKGNSWVFDSGSSASISVNNANKSAGPPIRTCKPTYKAERQILNQVKLMAQ